MRPTDKPAFSKLIAETWMAYNQAPEVGMIEKLFKELADFELSELASAMKAHLHDPGLGHFPPTISRLKRYLPVLDGRPDGEVIWALLPFDEGTAAFLPAEAMQAFWNTIYPALEAGKSPETARPFFMKDYARLVQLSRDRDEPLKIEVTLGQRGQGEHIRALQAAVKVGAVPLAYAQNWMQRVLPGHPAIEALPGPSAPGKSRDLVRIGHAA